MLRSKARLYDAAAKRIENQELGPLQDGSRDVLEGEPAGELAQGAGRRGCCGQVIQHVLSSVRGWGGRIRSQRSAINEIVTPLSTGSTCPVTIRDSSEARNTAILAMSSGSISPTRCAAASFVTRGLPASSRPRTRSVIVADGAIALPRPLWDARHFIPVYDARARAREATGTAASLIEA